MDDLARILKQLDIIYREPVVLKHGDKSDFYIDVKKAYGRPEVLNSISDRLWEQMDKRATCVATAGYGGISPATLIASRHDLKLTLVRDEPKKHGKGGWIDGYVPEKEDKVSIIDDVLTTGKSLKKMIDVIRPKGAEILGCYVVVKRGEAEDLDVPLHYLFVTEDLL